MRSSRASKTGTEPGRYTACVFDSHCHLDFETFDADRTQVLQRAVEAGVDRVFVPGVAPRQWQRAAELSREHSAVCSGVGLHPWWLAELEKAEVDEALGSLPVQATKLGAVAIGECGLDGLLAKRRGVPMERQRLVLERHLEVARDVGLPLVLHAVRAHGPLLECLKRFGRAEGAGVLHSFGGPADMVRPYAELGWSFSFSGAVTHVRASKARAALREVPVDRLLVESDGPDQPAAGVGERSEPAHVIRVLEVASELRGVGVQQLAVQSADNARRLFG